MKSARYHALRDRVLARVDHVFAEPIRLLPLDGSVVDADRDPVEFEAVLRTSRGDDSNLSGGTAQRWNMRFDAQKSVLFIDRAVYSIVRMRENDKIKALARPGQPLFEVGPIDDRGHARLVVELREA